jgi:hypothetical protein
MVVRLPMKFSPSRPARWALLLAVAGIAFTQKAPPPPVDEVLPKAPPEQPIPFNHKLHFASGLKCAGCHPIREPGFQAGYPRESACMGCHSSIKSTSPHIRKLAAAAEAKQPIPWVKVYSVPDYVWFSHAAHVQDAKIDCAECHGPVAEREVIAKERPTNMHSCMQCHAKHGASNGCDFCHNSQ